MLEPFAYRFDRGGAPNLGIDCDPDRAECAGFEEPCDNHACCDGMYCQTLVSNCGGGRSVCIPKPSQCAPEPVCGCDGRRYASECDAFDAGVDIGDVCAQSSWPAGSIACGGYYCDAATQFCRKDLTDTIGEEQDDYSCAPLPSGCGAIIDDGQYCDCVVTGAQIGISCTCAVEQGNGARGAVLSCVPI